MENGTCALCGENQNLCKSHYLPAGIYKTLQQGGGIIHADVRERRSYMSDKQITKTCLCRTCEDRFNKHGERWVIGDIFDKDQNFRLRSKLQDSDVSLDRYYPAEELFDSHEDYKHWLYFSISLLWRGSTIKGWRNLSENPYFGKLGEFYTRKFENYLLGGSFPDKVTVFIFVFVDAENYHPIVLPTTSKIDKDHGGGVRHSFLLPGVKTSVWVGGNQNLYKNKLPSSSSQLYFKLIEFTKTQEYLRQRSELIGTKMLGKLSS